MAILKFSSFLICLTVPFFLSSTPLAALVSHEGFTTNLIHRDSPLSPTYNPNLTKWDRLRTSLHRSVSRINLFRLSSSPDDFQSQVVPANGEYVMEVSLGTPPVPQFAIADTGSDLIWIQCQPCKSCYRQKLPIFDPRKSSSYKLESCDSNPCQELTTRTSCTQHNTCEYTYGYGDRSHTQGDLATETLTFGTRKGGKSATFPNIALGCGHENQGTFREEGSGLIGLGGGPLSLVSQLNSSMSGKFSYCLIPFLKEGNLSSKISFGHIGDVSGEGVVSTSLLKGAQDTFYFLSLEGMTVGDEENSTFVAFNRSSHSSNDYSGGQTEEANIIIDSGTTLTMIPPNMLSDLETDLTDKIRGKRVDDPSGMLSLCYEGSRDGEDLNIPTITVHFTGADVELKAVNTFIEVADDVVCLAMVEAEDMAIYGNIAQSNFLVGYDFEEGKVSFKPTDCSKD